MECVAKQTDGFARANQPSVGMAFALVETLTGVPALKTRKGRAYTRPKTGTAKSPQRDAFDTPPVGGVRRAMSSVSKFSGFVLDSSRSYAKWFKIKLLVTRYGLLVARCG
jgi:hypothetical protein